MPKDMVWVLGWRPKTRVHTVGQKTCFWIPKRVVFETHHVKKYGLGSGVAPQTRIPLHTLGQKSCFWRPKMVVFETHHAKNMVWVLEWYPKHAYLCTPWARKAVFGYLKG